MTQPTPRPKIPPLRIALMVGALALLVWVYTIRNPATPAATPVPLTAQPGYISKTMLGDAWPLTLTAGRLTCGQAQAVIFSAEDGTSYAVNSPAKGQAAALKLQPIESILLPGANPNALIDAGLKLCTS